MARRRFGGRALAHYGRSAVARVLCGPAFFAGACGWVYASLVCGSELGGRGGLVETQEMQSFTCRRTAGSGGVHACRLSRQPAHSPTFYNSPPHAYAHKTHPQAIYLEATHTYIRAAERPSLNLAAGGKPTDSVDGCMWSPAAASARFRRARLPWTASTPTHISLGHLRRSGLPLSAYFPAKLGVEDVYCGGIARVSKEVPFTDASPERQCAAFALS